MFNSFVHPKYPTREVVVSFNEATQNNFSRILATVQQIVDTYNISKSRQHALLKECRIPGSLKIGSVQLYDMRISQEWFEMYVAFNKARNDSYKIRRNEKNVAKGLSAEDLEIEQELARNSGRKYIDPETGCVEHIAAHFETRLAYAEFMIERRYRDHIQPYENQNNFEDLCIEHMQWAKKFHSAVLKGV